MFSIVIIQHIQPMGQSPSMHNHTFTYFVLHTITSMSVVLESSSCVCVYVKAFDSPSIWHLDLLSILWLKLPTLSPVLQKILVFINTFSFLCKNPLSLCDTLFVSRFQKGAEIV